MSKFFSKLVFQPIVITLMNHLVGQFASFPVVSITSIGAFLDCGEPKDLFLPLSEQIERLEIGYVVAVYVFLDKQERPCATMRLERFAAEDKPSYQPENKVHGLIYHETELGYKVLVDEKYLGLLYKNEVFKKLEVGDQVEAYVKKVREDRKIDLNLRPAGHFASLDIGENILKLLKQHQGFLPLVDTVAPEKIYDLFGVSKKKYKMALGQLYKGRKIKIAADGIHLI